MHISAANHPFQQRPEILQPIRVDLHAHIRFRMVDRFVNIVRIQPFIRYQQIGEHFRPDLGPNNPLAGIRYDFALPLLGVLWRSSKPPRPFATLTLVHIASLAVEIWISSLSTSLFTLENDLA